MVGMGQRTAVLTIARFANYGLMLISPVILVRVLSVEQFGEYRQFVVYASFLQLFAAFSFTESLLYFVPSHANSPWRIANQTNLLTALSSIAVCTALALLDVLTHGGIVGEYMLPLIAYVVLYVNLDHWEYFLLANNRPMAVFGYTAGRLTLRMITVVVVALVTTNVRAIIWGLVLFEAVRFIGSVIMSRAMNRSASEQPLDGLWREQLRYCVPTGFAMLLTVANRNLGNVAVVKGLGPAALAQYTIGTYADYLYLALGNSIALVLLSEMVRRNSESAGSGGLPLWQKTTVVNSILLLPVGILLARFAEPVILTVFGKNYRPAIPVMQVHMIFMIRACFDFSPAVRAINKTRSLVYSNLGAVAVNAIALTFLIPAAGIVGAVGSLVIASFAEALILGSCTIYHYRVPWSQFVPWRRVGKVALAAGLAGLVAYSSVWNRFGIVGVILASALYYLLFALLLKLFKVQELDLLLQRVVRSLNSLRSS